MKPSILLALLLAFQVQLDVQAKTPAQNYWYFPFDETRADFRDKGPNRLKGRYIPSDSADNDNAQTTNPDRYRLPGANGNALFFHKELGSAAPVENFQLKEPTRKLYLQFHIKAHPTGRETVLGCKWDSGNDGFILFASLGRWIFYYGDGTKSYKVEFTGSALNASQWIPVSLYFDKGTVTLTENGKVLGSTKTDGTHIAPNKAPLVIGNYQRGFWKTYPFGGGLDDLCITHTPKTAIRLLGKPKTVKRPELEVSLEPVDGNDQHFGGRKTLHVFPGYPVSVTLRFRCLSDKMRGKKELMVNPRLVFHVPQGVELQEAFAQSWTPRRAISFNRRAITRHGKDYTEYSLPEGMTGEIAMRSGFGREELTLVFRIPENFKRGNVYWRTKYTEPAQFRLEAMPLPTYGPLPPGRFTVMGYISAGELLYGDRKSLDQIAQLYANAGFLGFGRNRTKTPIRMQAEQHIQKKFGFQFYEINLWAGPQKRRTNREVPPAVTSKGTVDDSQYCPYEMTQSQKLFDDYVVALQQSIAKTGTKAVILDYEPWGEPAKICYCKRCLQRFAKRFNLDEKSLTPQTIRDNYRTQWGLFWTENTHAMTDFMARVARKVVPGAQVWDYTYLFDYDQPSYQQRFWSIPKNPLDLETIVDNSMLSLYHVNGSKLIDQVDTSLKHLKKDVSAIILLSKDNLSQGAYTTPQESLSPVQIRQKLVLLGALGIKDAGIYPGGYVDYAFIPEIGKAVRQVRKHEHFYLKGKRVDHDVKVSPPARCIAWEYQGDILLTVFNFSNRNGTFPILWRGKPVRDAKLKAWDVDFITLNRQKNP